MIAGGTSSHRTPFFGRTREQAFLAAQLDAGSHLVTVAGPSGMGKTRLARQVTARVEPRFRDGGGAWFCDLAAARSAADLQAAVAGALDIPQRQGPQLARAIASRGPLLLILDNLEHVARQASQVLGDWLDHAAELQILVTSVVPTGMDDEVVFELGPLEAEDAVAFYLERASRVQAGRAFPPIEQAAVGELVARLDRIPLAIELAAARARVLPPRALLARIGERFELLQSGRSGRHGSLSRALLLSWDLLGEAEQRALAMLSVFVGGFSLEGAEALLGPGEDTLALLDSLRAMALIQAADSEPRRFTLYESVREFAGIRLDALGLRAETLERHAAYFVTEGERQARIAEGPEAPSAARWLVAERDDLAAAHRRCADERGDPEAAARIGLALAVILGKQGPPALEVELLDSTVLAARRSGDRSLLAKALLARAVATKRHGVLQDARALLDEGLAVARAAGSLADEARILVESGAVGSRTGELERAEGELHTALSIARDLPDPLIEGTAHHMLGAVEEARGSLEASAAAFDRALRIFRRCGHLRLEGVALLSLGAVWSGLARFRDARRVLHEAADVFAKLEDRASVANVWMNLGSVDLTAGRLDDSEAWSMRALVVEREIGNRRFEGLAIGNLGLVSLERGETLLAEQRLGEAVAILQESGEKRFHAINLCFLSVAEALLGKAAEARADFEEARSYFAAFGDRPSLQMMEVLEGMLELAACRRLRVEGEDAEADALEAQVRERLARARGDDVAHTESLFLSIRLLEKTLARREVAADEPATAATERALRIGPEAAWFELDGSERVDLSRRGAVRRLFHGLVEQRLLAPGVGLGLDALFGLGWPGQSIHPDAAATRVYSGIRTLRSLGLSEVLLRHADGYLVDPSLPISRSPGRLAAG